MTEAPSILLVAVIGSIAQVMDGSLGMGFGVFSSSMLMATGFAPSTAVAVVNAAKIFTGLASGLAHWRLGNMRMEWCIPLSLGGVAGGFLGGYLLTSIPPQAAKPWVSSFLLVVGLLIILRSLRWQTPCASQVWQEECEQCPKGNWQRLSAEVARGTTAKLGALGFLAALVNGLSGAYGPIATSGLLLVRNGEPRHAIGTVSLAEFAVAGTVASTILWRQGFGEFPGGMVAALAIGGIMAAPLAAYLCRRFPPRGLAFLVGSALIALNLRVVTWFVL